MSDWKRLFAPVAIVAFLPGVSYAAKYLTLQEVQHLTFPEATAFEAHHVLFSVDQIQQIELQSGVKVQTRGQQIWHAMNEEKLLGYLIVDYVIGKHLAIDYAIALTPERTVKQLEILEYRESYGGEIRNADWLKQFEAKELSSKLSLNDDILNISGATLSCRHITEGVKRVLTMMNVVPH